MANSAFNVILNVLLFKYDKEEIIELVSKVNENKYEEEDPNINELLALSLLKIKNIDGISKGIDINLRKINKKEKEINNENGVKAKKETKEKNKEIKVDERCGSNFTTHGRPCMKRPSKGQKHCSLHLDSEKKSKSGVKQGKCKFVLQRGERKNHYCRKPSHKNDFNRCSSHIGKVSKATLDPDLDSSTENEEEVENTEESVPLIENEEEVSENNENENTIEIDILDEYGDEGVTAF